MYGLYVYGAYFHTPKLISAWLLISTSGFPVSTRACWFLDVRGCTPADVGDHWQANSFALQWILGIDFYITPLLGLSLSLDDICTYINIYIYIEICNCIYIYTRIYFVLGSKKQLGPSTKNMTAVLPPEDLGAMISPPFISPC